MFFLVTWSVFMYFVCIFSRFYRLFDLPSRLQTAQVCASTPLIHPSLSILYWCCLLVDYCLPPFASVFPSPPLCMMGVLIPSPSLVSPDTPPPLITCTYHFTLISCTFSDISPTFILPPICYSLFCPALLHTQFPVISTTPPIGEYNVNLNDMSNTFGLHVSKL